MITNCGACQYSVKLLFFSRWQLLSTYSQFHFPSFCMCVSLLLNILTHVTGCLMYLNNPPSQPQPSPLWVRLPHPPGPCPATPGAPQLGCPPGCPGQAPRRRAPCSCRLGSEPCAASPSSPGGVSSSRTPLCVQLLPSTPARFLGHADASRPP